MPVIERMLPMLRFFSHGDDGLAVIQGVADPSVREMRAVFGQDTTLGRPVSLAAYSGFSRMAHGGTAVITDFGPDAACLGPLAFEFSDGPSRIVVNCGYPADGVEALGLRRLRAGGAQYAEPRRLRGREGARCLELADER